MDTGFEDLSGIQLPPPPPSLLRHDEKLSSVFNRGSRSSAPKGAPLQSAPKPKHKNAHEQAQPPNRESSAQNGKRKAAGKDPDGSGGGSAVDAGGHAARTGEGGEHATGGETQNGSKTWLVRVYDDLTRRAWQWCEPGWVRAQKVTMQGVEQVRGYSIRMWEAHRTLLTIVAAALASVAAICAVLHFVLWGDGASVYLDDKKDNDGSWAWVMKVKAAILERGGKGKSLVSPNKQREKKAAKVGLSSPPGSSLTQTRKRIKPCRAQVVSPDKPSLPHASATNPQAKQKTPKQTPSKPMPKAQHSAPGAAGRVQVNASRDTDAPAALALRAHAEPLSDERMLQSQGLSAGDQDRAARDEGSAGVAGAHPLSTSPSPSPLATDIDVHDADGAVLKAEGGCETVQAPAGPLAPKLSPKQTLAQEVKEPAEPKVVARADPDTPDAMPLGDTEDLPVATVSSRDAVAAAPEGLAESGVRLEDVPALARDDGTDEADEEGDRARHDANSLGPKLMSKGGTAAAVSEGSEGTDNCVAREEGPSHRPHSPAPIDDPCTTPPPSTAVRADLSTPPPFTASEAPPNASHGEHIRQILGIIRGTKPAESRVGAGDDQEEGRTELDPTRTRSAEERDKIKSLEQQILNLGGTLDTSGAAIMLAAASTASGDSVGAAAAADAPLQTPPGRANNDTQGQTKRRCRPLALSVLQEDEGSHRGSPEAGPVKPSASPGQQLRELLHIGMDQRRDVAQGKAQVQAQIASDTAGAQAETFGGPEGDEAKISLEAAVAALNLGTQVCLCLCLRASLALFRLYL